MASGIASAQQAADPKYKPPLPRPAYESGKGPRVAIDEAHYNFHTAEERYKPFAEFLRRDGYPVNGLRQPFSAESLKDVDVLVISNALHKSNEESWAPPNPSAFTKDEIAALHRWVEKGGSLFLIADHAPFAGAASELGKAFGVEFGNGRAMAGHWKSPNSEETFERGTGLKECTITRGRADKEKVTKVATFTGSAFKPPKGATPVLVFGAKSELFERKAKGEGGFEVQTIPIEGWCQGAVLKVGKGRVAVFGEAAMFSAQLTRGLLWSCQIELGEGTMFRAQLVGLKRPMGMNAPEAKQNHQLLLNVMHWLSRVKGMAD
ncbi:MAG TPA: DUF4350 domain-containing protein [Gemmataceae bacterium]|nr:DUF4350 domain-containing protein [Gemmataceae bacterium]